MEYQKTINVVDNKPNQPSKFRTKNWVEIDDDLQVVYSTGSQIKFKIVMLNSSLCNCSDVYIPVSGKIIITRGPSDTAAENKRTD